jgi:hypothetical protein
MLRKFFCETKINSYDFTYKNKFLCSDYPRLSEEAELESVSRHASCKNKQPSSNVTNERAEITRSFLDSIIKSPAGGPAHRGDRKNGSVP